MRFKYGNFQHDDNEVAFTRISRVLVRGQNGRANTLREEWGLRGKIIKPTQSALFAALADRQAAYAYDGYSATLLDNSGKQTFLLDNNTAIGGVRVTQNISHGEIKGAGCTTFLEYQFALTADIFSAPGGYLSFQESLSFNDIDGGPIQVERIPAQGPPILQNVSEQSWFYATQSGQLTQQGPGVAPAPPIFPGLLRRQPGSRVITYMPVKVIKGFPIEYGVSWQYQYISESPISGRPTIAG